MQGAAAELRASILRELLVLAELAAGAWSGEVPAIGPLADLAGALVGDEEIARLSESNAARMSAA